jgi:hypothetical protein
MRSSVERTRPSKMAKTFIWQVNAKRKIGSEEMIEATSVLTHLCLVYMFSFLMSNMSLD